MQLKDRAKISKMMHKFLGKKHSSAIAKHVWQIDMAEGITLHATNGHVLAILTLKDTEGNEDFEAQIGTEANENGDKLDKLMPFIIGPIDEAAKVKRVNPKYITLALGAFEVLRSMYAIGPQVDIQVGKDGEGMLFFTENVHYRFKVLIMPMRKD